MEQLKRLDDSEKLKTFSKSIYVKTNPRKWSGKEECFVFEKINAGYPMSEVAEALGRSEISIQNKYRRMRKRNNTYNEKHLKEKYDSNMRFLDMVKPKTILDLFCGVSKYWLTHTDADVISNDHNKDITGIDYNMDSEKLLHRYLSMERIPHFDMIDVDPYGSPYGCLDGAIQLVRKGLIISYGEIGCHKRLKRTDYLSARYGVKNAGDITLDDAIRETQRIGKIHKKNLIPMIRGEWGGFKRVYYLVEDIKLKPKDLSNGNARNNSGNNPEKNIK